MESIAPFIIPGSLANYMGNLFQIGFVTRDLDKSIEYLKEKYGVSKLSTRTSTLPLAKYRGKVVESTIAASHAYLGNIFIEVIQPIAGENPYDDYLTDPEKVLNFHHFCVKVDDWEIAAADVKKAGYEFCFEGQNPKAGIQFGYIDMTKEMGCMFEIISGGDPFFEQLKNGDY
jgi:hypothetical protein